MRARAIVLLLVLATFAVFVYGVMRLGWDFDQMSALFFAMGVAGGTDWRARRRRHGAQASSPASPSMAYAAMLIGFARAIFVVLDQGRIIDTIVNALVTPLQTSAGDAVRARHDGRAGGVHGPVPSVSGQAVLTMPVLVPMSDLIGLSRQVVVLAYQYGAGLDRASHADQRRADGRHRRGGRRVRRLAVSSPCRSTPRSSAFGAVAIVVAIAIGF